MPFVWSATEQAVKRTQALHHHHAIKTCLIRVGREMATTARALPMH
jgi:hypothetical protein